MRTFDKNIMIYSIKLIGHIESGSREMAGGGGRDNKERAPIKLNINQTNLLLIFKVRRGPYAL